VVRPEALVEARVAAIPLALLGELSLPQEKFGEP